MIYKFYNVCGYKEHPNKATEHVCCSHNHRKFEDTVKCMEELEKEGFYYFVIDEEGNVI